MVRWRESILWLTNEGNVSELVEIGAGKVLSGLARRINRDAKTISISNPEQIEAFIAKG